ncbi:hypothetical protein BJ742DRAFT_300765 [Cladochytrium replicatum]|nr:hypothetical protein BJ742DRAFT_300765 [Cladochytrium replicatum]
MVADSKGSPGTEITVSAMENTSPSYFRGNSTDDSRRILRPPPPSLDRSAVSLPGYPPTHIPAGIPAPPSVPSHSILHSPDTHSPITPQEELEEIRAQITTLGRMFKETLEEIASGTPDEFDEEQENKVRHARMVSGGVKSSMSNNGDEAAANTMNRRRVDDDGDSFGSRERGRNTGGRSMSRNTVRRSTKKRTIDWADQQDSGNDSELSSDERSSDSDTYSSISQRRSGRQRGDSSYGPENIGFDRYPTASVEPMSTRFGNRLSDIRKRVYILFTYPRSSILATQIQMIVGISVVLSIISFVLETIIPLNSTVQQNMLWKYMEVTVTAILGGEWLIRLVTYPGKPWYEFLLHPLNICDFLGVLPIVIEMLSVDKIGSLSVLQVLRPLRLFRLVKLAMMNRQIRLLARALVIARDGLLLLFLTFLLSVLLASSFVYYTERIYCVQENGMLVDIVTKEECNYQSIVDAFWWGVVTLTTTGYGDSIPKYWPGRIVAGLTMTTGLIVFSVSVSLVSNALSTLHDELRSKRELRAFGDKRMKGRKLHEKHKINGFLKIARAFSDLMRTAGLKRRPPSEHKTPLDISAPPKAFTAESIALTQLAMERTTTTLNDSNGDTRGPISPFDNSQSRQDVKIVVDGLEDPFAEDSSQSHLSLHSRSRRRAEHRLGLRKAASFDSFGAPASRSTSPTPEPLNAGFASGPETVRTTPQRPPFQPVPRLPAVSTSSHDHLAKSVVGAAMWDDPNIPSPPTVGDPRRLLVHELDVRTPQLNDPLELLETIERYMLFVEGKAADLKERAKDLRMLKVGLGDVFRVVEALTKESSPTYNPTVVPTPGPFATTTGATSMPMLVVDQGVSDLGDAQRILSSSAPSVSGKRASRIMFEPGSVSSVHQLAGNRLSSAGNLSSAGSLDVLDARTRSGHHRRHKGRSVNPNERPNSDLPD